MTEATTDEAPLTRREAVWRACDAISAAGAKPALRSVRQHNVKGSDPDVQSEIKGWYEQVFSHHHHRKSIPGLPPEVATLFLSVFAQCSDLARAQFNDDRFRLERDRDESEAKATAALTAVNELNETGIRKDRAIGDLEHDLHGARDMISGLRTEVEAAHLRGLERDEAHRAALERQAGEHRAALQEDRIAHERLVAHLNGVVAEQQLTIGRANEQYKALQVTQAKDVESRRKAEAGQAKAEAAQADCRKELAAAQSELQDRDAWLDRQSGVVADLRAALEVAERRRSELESTLARTIKRTTPDFVLRLKARDKRG